MPGTTPKARAIGAELRRARESAGYGLRELATEVGTSHASLSRWETGQRAPRPEDVAVFLTAVNAPAEQREELIELARDPDGSHWLSINMPDRQRQLATLLEIERDATAITAVSPLLIPGLLQTADYARAMMIAGDVDHDEIDMRVAVRVGRREAITRRNPARLSAVIWEPVLYQEIGGHELMADQLRTLHDYGHRDNVELRVIPTRCPWHPGLEGPFALTEFDDRDAVVHLENRISGLFLHDPDEVKRYRDAVNKVREVAMSPSDSLRLVADVINSKETTA
ncbi:Transcriptional regulator, contains XRE-family HTH domain [Haloechinothrix alba]|uniref:Transcriptional regulator, contains XRE-family HTH domain n=1 Tax=Haloechinothrix alba TaxID=664784 RepID=A0A238ZF48_9PSEU|nr:Transcriptional regulator, contains XRE-family HTH domain [Haloechinothrix alba]